MKAMVIDRYGKNVPLRLMERPTPLVGEHEVLVEIHAASINPIDFKIRDGIVRLLAKYEFPLTLGNDFSGTIIQVGSKVTKFSSGDEVFGRPRKTRIGTFAEMIAVHEDDIALKPANLSFEEAASIPLVGLTTIQAFEMMGLKAGQKVFIPAGSGGVGTFAIQLAKEMGALVATTVSEKGYDLVKSLGADVIVNYKKESFAEILKNNDAVFDTVGKDTLVKSFEILKPLGKIVSIAALPDAKFARKENLGLFRMILFSLVNLKTASLENKYNVEYLYHFMKPSGKQLTFIKGLIEQGKIIPVIDRVYPFVDTQEALDYVETGRSKGKVIVRIK
ncbi:NADP-dependent oxidoreductase [Neobacillus sp. GCM10023253]|uniref:NADP-dependent oxidoreductase n=1 Tax=Neobacillus sp. GCM10023253 TaxID=3252644 RepID=UPI0036088626